MLYAKTCLHVNAAAVPSVFSLQPVFLTMKKKICVICGQEVSCGNLRYFNSVLTLVNILSKTPGAGENKKPSPDADTLERGGRGWGHIICLPSATVVYVFSL
jgi:hypothetical protein